MGRSAEADVDVRDRIESAILSARAIAQTPEAVALVNRTGGKFGTWTREDEANLRAGFMMIWNENRRRFERLDLPSAQAERAQKEASPARATPARPSAPTSPAPGPSARADRGASPPAPGRAAGDSRR